MSRKTVYLLIILFAFVTSIMVNNPSFRPPGYNWLLNLYAAQVSGSGINIVYNPGIRKIETPLQSIQAKAVLPDDSLGYKERLKQLLKEDCGALVECSALDTWHTTREGQDYLMKIRSQAYRVVVLDGGHHLPTLGLAPDILIIPRIHGYAAHSYMLDGIKIDKILEMVKNAQVPAVIVTVPRWALVKNEQCLINITEQVLSSLQYNHDLPDPSFSPVAKLRISKYGRSVFTYIDREYAGDLPLFLQQIETLGIQDVDRIYLAFNFKYTSLSEAEEYRFKVQTRLKRSVEIVNQPVKVTNAFWSGE